jgi:hypothetical protein
MRLVDRSQGGSGSSGNRSAYTRLACSAAAGCPLASMARTAKSYPTGLPGARRERIVASACILRHMARRSKVRSIPT